MSNFVSRLLAPVLEAQWKPPAGWSGGTGEALPTVHIAVVGLSGAGRRTFLHATALGDVGTRVSADGTATLDEASSNAGGVRLSSWCVSAVTATTSGRTAQDQSASSASPPPSSSSAAAPSSTNDWTALQGLLRQGVTCVLAVVDASDPPSWPAMRVQLQRLHAAPFTASAPLLVVANKCDVGGAAPANRVVAAVGAEAWTRGGCGRRRQRYSASCSALTGAGVRDALAMACALSLSDRTDDDGGNSGSDSSCGSDADGGNGGYSDRAHGGSVAGSGGGGGGGGGRGTGDVATARRRRRVDGTGKPKRDPINASAAAALASKAKRAKQKKRSKVVDPYAEWLREASAKQAADQARGATAVQRASRQQYFLALFCLFGAIAIHTLLRRLFGGDGAWRT